MIREAQKVLEPSGREVIIPIEEDELTEEEKVSFRFNPGDIVLTDAGVDDFAGDEYVVIRRSIGRIERGSARWYEVRLVEFPDDRTVEFHESDLR